MSGAVPECTMPELPLQAGWSWSRLGVLGYTVPGLSLQDSKHGLGGKGVVSECTVPELSWGGWLELV